MTDTHEPPTDPGVILPWRSFKTFVQLYDVLNGVTVSHRQKLMVHSNTIAGDRNRAPLIEHGLIAVEKIEKAIKVHYIKGAPYGRHNPGDFLVAPEVGSAMGMAWMMTAGHCYYCGEHLHFFAKATLGADSVYACRTCHKSKGPRTLEEFRFIQSMHAFEQQHGLRFSRQQVDYLKQQHNCELDLPKITFWFETQGFDRPPE